MLKIKLKISNYPKIYAKNSEDPAKCVGELSGE